MSLLAICFLMLARLELAIAFSEDAKTTVTIDSFSFRVPEHLVLEKITDTSLCQWPIVATWDADGNLVIAESAGVKQPVQEQRQTRPHRIVRLIDSDRRGDTTCFKTVEWGDP